MHPDLLAAVEKHAPVAGAGAKQELVIRWAPIPGTAQQQFFEDDTPESNILLTGGWGSGKTMTLAGKALKLSAINAPLPIIWTVPDWGHVLDTVIPMLESLDPETGEPWFLRSDQYHYHQTNHVLRWDGGGPIHFASAENPKSIAGPNMAAAVVDEPGSISLPAWRNTVARVRHPSAVLRQKVAAGTPEGLNWLCELFDNPERPEAYKLYTMPTEANTELLKHHPDYLAQVRDGATDAEIATYLGGRFVNTTGSLAYPKFDEAKHWRENIEHREAAPLRLSFDFNVEPMCCVIAQIDMGDKGPELNVLDAVVKYGATVADLCAEVLERLPRLQSRIYIYGDASGANRSHQSLRSNYDVIQETLAPALIRRKYAEPEYQGRFEMRVPRANPAVSNRINAMNRLMEDANGRVRLAIRKTLPAKQCRTRELVRSLKRTSVKPGTTDIWKPAGETITHCSDALGYLVVAEFSVEKPRVSFGTMHVDWLT